MGRAVNSSQASCFPQLWNGSVTDTCGNTVSYEIDLPTDNNSTKSVVLTADNSGTTGNPQCAYCTYVPTSNFYQSSGLAYWGPRSVTSVPLDKYSTPLPNGGLAYVTCNLTQNTRLYSVTYDP